MKTIVLAVSAVAMSAATASAADLAVKAPPLASAAPCIWCGFYAGVNVGYGWSQDTSINSAATVASVPSTIAAAAPAAAAAALTTPIPVGNRNGFVGGGQVGYNFQAGNFVAGIEADIQGLSGKGTGTVVTSVPVPGFPVTSNATLTATNSLNWLGTLRGRVGLAVAPNLLLFGTGGLAYGGVSSSTTIGETFVGAVPGVSGTFPAFGSFSQTRVGWAAGAGGEWMFSGNWSAKLEYLHYDLGTASYGTTVSNFSTAGAPARLGVGTLLYTLNQTSSTRFSGEFVRVGVNYKFGPTALVAKD